MRVYPADGRGAGEGRETRLGAHCDGNLFTLLWTDAAGFEALDPAQCGGCSAADVLSFGFPTLGPPPAADLAAGFAEVGGLAGTGRLLFTVGGAWLTDGSVQRWWPGAVQSAVLHRVVKGGASAGRCPFWPTCIH